MFLYLPCLNFNWNSTIQNLALISIPPLSSQAHSPKFRAMVGGRQGLDGCFVCLRLPTTRRRDTIIIIIEEERLLGGCWTCRKWWLVPGWDEKMCVWRGVMWRRRDHAAPEIIQFSLWMESPSTQLTSNHHQPLSPSSLSLYLSLSPSLSFFFLQRTSMHSDQKNGPK